MSGKYMEIHFVCVGNLYRSRLAEAYFNSLAPHGVHAVSSGILGGEQSIAISWYAQHILKENKLMSYTRKMTRQTTKRNVQHSDVLVFFKHETFVFCRQWLDPTRQRWVIWSIPDVRAVRPSPYFMGMCEQTFRSIKRHVDQLKKTYALS